MKRLIAPTLLSVLFFAAAEGARAQSTAPKAEPPRAVVKVDEPAGAASPDAGRLEGGIYTNDFFGVSFALPKGWAVLGNDENKKIVDRGKEVMTEGATEKKKAGIDSSIGRTNFLVTTSKFPPGTPATGFNAMLVCIAERVPTAVIKSGADYITAMQRAFEGTAGKLELTAPVRTETVGGVAFAVADVKMTAGTMTAAQRYYVRITKGYAFAMGFTYFDQPDLKALDEVIRSVKFK